MAHAGQLLESPASRERVVFRKTATETDGALLELDFFIRPGQAVLATHLHPAQEERFRVRAGTFRLRRGKDELVLRSGDSATVLAGVSHHLENEGDSEAHAVVQFAPALRTEELFQCLFAATANANGRWSRLLAISACLSEHPEEILLARLPRALQGPLLRLGARLARRVVT